MSTDTAAVSRPGGPGRWRGSRAFQGPRMMGPGRQLPIAVPPTARIFDGPGQDDAFGSTGPHRDRVVTMFVGAGGALLDGGFRAPMPSCAGGAVGIAKRADGPTVLAAVTGFLVRRLTPGRGLAERLRRPRI